MPRVRRIRADRTRRGLHTNQIGKSALDGCRNEWQGVGKKSRDLEKEEARLSSGPKSMQTRCSGKRGGGQKEKTGITLAGDREIWGKRAVKNSRTLRPSPFAGGPPLRGNSFRWLPPEGGNGRPGGRSVGKRDARRSTLILLCSQRCGLLSLGPKKKAALGGQGGANYSSGSPVGAG